MLPEAPPEETGAVKAWEQGVVMPTWEPAKPDVHPLFLEKRVYQGSSGRVYPLPVIDQIATEPVRKTWRAIHLENEYVRLMIMPELGGRIHVGLDKLNGYDFFYRQDVIKPALVGLAGPWISGGVEFNWPQHHRPATYMAVEVSIERSKDGSITVWCSDHDPMARMKGMHGVCLHPGKSLVELKVRLHNRTLDTQTFLWWANVATRVHEHYQSFFPHDVNCAADHAKRALTEFPLSESNYYGIDYKKRAKEGVPEEDRPRMFCPDGSYPANDLSRYANIPVPTSYMIANSAQDYFGGYDHHLQAGIVHVANHHVAPGKKQWTWGNQEFGYAWDRCLTECGGPYIELMAGVYTDNQPDFSFLAPGETKSFTQYWYPIRSMGVPDFANAHAALSRSQGEDASTICLQATHVVSEATVEVRIAEEVVAYWHGALSPEAVLKLSVPRREGCWVLVLQSCHQTLLRWSPDEIEMQPKPEAATEPLLPEQIESLDELYLTGVHLEQYRHPTRNPESYWMEALRRDQGDSRSNTAMGRWHLRRGECAIAEGYLRRAIARLTMRNPNPSEGEAYYQLGLALDWQEKESAAYAAWYKATWNAAWRGPAYQRIAEVDCRRKEWDKARDHIRRVLAVDCENLNARALHAVILRALGDSSAAATVLEESLHFDPLDAMARYLLKRVMPEDGQQRLDLAFDLLRWGQYDDALALTQQPVDGQPNGAGTLLQYLQAHVLLRMGDGRSARAAWIAASQEDARYVFPSRLEELRLLEDSLRNNAADANAHFYLGNLLYDRRRHHEAMMHWEKSVELGSTNATVFRNLGIGYFNRSNDPQRADAAFVKARQISPFDARLLYEHDQLAKRMGRPLQVRLTDLLAHKGLVAQRDDLTVELAALLNHAGRAQQALDLLLSRKFQPWEGGEGMVLAQYVRARLRLCVEALSLGNAADAIQHGKAALAPPENLGETWHPLANRSQVFYWLGVAFSKDENTGEANHYWRKAATQNGDFLQMKVQSVSEMTCWSALALRHLGEEQAALALLDQIQTFAGQRMQQKPTIDYFATSLPAMLLFEADLEAQQQVQMLYLEAQVDFVSGHENEGRARLKRLFAIDNSYAPALDWQAFWQRCNRDGHSIDSAEMVVKP